MNSLNAQQLAFILDIKKEDARARMCNAWCKAHGIEKTGFKKTQIAKTDRTKGKKVVDPYPHDMSIGMLAEQLNLPTLQSMVDDIRDNYLNRPATRRYILQLYPEKKILSGEADGKTYPIPVDLPPALKSMLPTETIKTIYNAWINGFKTIRMEPKISVDRKSVGW
jgi:hypothetical protein